jgi:hypothetical protein
MMASTASITLIMGLSFIPGFLKKEEKREVISL